MDENPRLLFVDDDPVHEIMVPLIFKPLGFGVDITSDGRTALRMMTERFYSVVFLDLNLNSDFDGYDVIRGLATQQSAHAGDDRHHQQLSRVVVCTGYSCLSTENARVLRTHGCRRLWKRAADVDTFQVVGCCVAEQLVTVETWTQWTRELSMDAYASPRPSASGQISCNSFLLKEYIRASGQSGWHEL